MRTLLCLLLPWFLAAQEPAVVHSLTLDLHTKLGADPAADIRLAMPGCWDGLLLSSTVAAQSPPRAKRRQAEATVEVWDVVFQESRSQETFRLFREDLLLSIKGNWRFAPPTHGRIDAAIRGSGAGADMAMVQSLQQRFNRLPPNGSPAKVRL